MSFKAISGLAALAAIVAMGSFGSAVCWAASISTPECWIDADAGTTHITRGGYRITGDSMDPMVTALQLQELVHSGACQRRTTLTSRCRIDADAGKTALMIDGFQATQYLDDPRATAEVALRLDLIGACELSVSDCDIDANTDESFVKMNGFQASTSMDNVLLTASLLRDLERMGVCESRFAHR